MSYCDYLCQNPISNVFRNLIIFLRNWLNRSGRNDDGQTVQVIRIRPDGSRFTEKMRLPQRSLGGSLWFWTLMVFLLLIGMSFWLRAEGGNGKSLSIPNSEYGISIGNSHVFNGLRINFRDRYVRRINGINVTLWSADHNERAIVKGLSLGIMPEAGELSGINLGIVGVAGEESVSGVSFGLLGIGAGHDVRGINIGGIGAGAGGSVSGINFGGIGLGAGEDLSGLNFGGVGVGAGKDLLGVSVGLLGVGAGEDITGITFGGLGVGGGTDVAGITVSLLGVGAGGNATGLQIAGIGLGAGTSLTGINLAGIGVGAGESVTGLNLAGVGVGSGGELKWISIAGIGVGAPYVKGFAFGGAGAGGIDVTGVIGAIGMVSIEDGGLLTGLSAAGFNRIKGHQQGVSIGIVNYARSLKGVQLGLINYVRDNPRFLKVLPLINFNFSD